MSRQYFCRQYFAPLLLQASAKPDSVQELWLWGVDGNLPHTADETIFYAANVTSNDPVLSCISPIAVRIRPSAMSGRNLQYFRRIAAIARSRSARSVGKRAFP